VADGGLGFCRLAAFARARCPLAQEFSANGKKGSAADPFLPGGARLAWEIDINSCLRIYIY
jgi:hypothetical protein